MKRLLLILVGVGCATLIVGWLLRDQLLFAFLSITLKPKQSFAETSAPSAPDYANPASWAALPKRDDSADVTPPGEIDSQAHALVDVFFVHPTTYLTSKGWNQPLGDRRANDFVDEFVMTGQASAFNGCCRIYAPRYRQATLYSFFDLEGDGSEALELAYGDVERAFDHFVEQLNDGRPFVLAGHSQGSRHLEVLLARRISGSPLRERMVAAYPVGYGIERSNLTADSPDIAVCSGPYELGCLVTWNTVGERVADFVDTSDHVCVNPLTWRADEEAAGHELNLGALSSGDERRIDVGAADAQCRNGRLFLTEIRTDAFDNLPLYMGRDNHHVLDYALYWTNIRRNAEERVATYVQQHLSP